VAAAVATGILAQAAHFYGPVTFKVELATPDRAASFLGRTGVEVVGPLTVQATADNFWKRGCILVSDINAEQDIPLSSSNLPRRSTEFCSSYGDRVMPDIACLGDLVADLLGRPIDSLPERGRLGLVDQMTLHIGAALRIRLLTWRCWCKNRRAGKVGNDGLGEFVVHTLERSGLDTQGVVKDSDVTTSASWS